MTAATWTRTEAAQRIIQQAEHFVGLQEVKANAAWDNFATPGPDPTALELEREMLASGWVHGWPYCAAFCEVVLRLAYTGLGASGPSLARLLNALTPGVLRTKQQLQRAGYPVVLDASGAVPGAMHFMRLGNTTNGHAGIVVDRAGPRIRCIDGNTGPGAATGAQDRDGDGVWRRVRTLDTTRSPSRLYFVGFLLPMSSDELVDTTSQRGKRR